MSEMKLIMERWNKYLVEEENGITIGDFHDGMLKFMPGTMQKILGSKAFKWIVTAGGTTAAALGASAAAPAAATGAAVLGGVAGNISLGWLIDKIANSGDEIAAAISVRARKQVPDNKRDGLALYYDIDDGYEKMIGGINSELGKEFIKDGLYVEYSTAFSRIKSDIAAIGNDLPAVQAYLDQPLSAIGINKTASQLFKDMLKGEDGMSFPSMDNRKVDATPIA